MKFYIASSFQNIDSVKYVSEVLKNKGYIHTYDWTKNERVSTIEKLQAIGQEEKNGVLNADILVVLLPAGKGSHIEFGIALGQGKKVFLYSPNDDVRDLETTSTFYHLPEVEIVIGTIDELIDTITTRIR
ncbi:group-specific protein [Bacillus sp. FJAT-22090]|uniref:nucleoside 2-deoxyribosyltransferase n=1 Tax=Bacillus sp. FJAT-22090 TaxID=1581038 RepID=UPI0006AE97BA|nr:nucleoside 2-deoxyribosyltransferase [Bacillus sp. FJAT-22090]ALC87843.1 group-specific protein [Bacillus sp. FJAT-22090]